MSRSLRSQMVPSEMRGPQGLKPAFLPTGNGTAEAVPFPKIFVLLSEGFINFLKISALALFTLALLAGVAAAQNSPPTVYAESFRRGPTRITEDKFEIKLTPDNPSYKQRLRDSSGAERYELTITPKIGEGEGNDKITSWLVSLRDLRHGIYGNLLQFDQELSEEPRDNLYWLNPVQSAPVPILAKRIIRVEGFYLVFQVKDYRNDPRDSPYLDLMTMQWELTNCDPRAAGENK